MRSKKCKRKNLLGCSDRKKKVALVSGKNLNGYNNELNVQVNKSVCRRAVHRLHAARHRHPRGLGRHQEGTKT